jgi:hypothetical protein
MAHASLLDRQMPGWKQSALQDAFLEDLLAEAVKSRFPAKALPSLAAPESCYDWRYSSREAN